mgnify:CR=1 FL=1
MKHFTKLLAAVALVAAVCVGFASCGDDNKGDEPKPSSKLTLINTFKFSASADFVELADIKVDYTDFAGVKHTKAVAAGDNVIKFSTATFPASSSFAITVTPKTAELVKEKYDVAYSIELGTDVQDATGKIAPVGEFGKYSQKYEGLKKEGVPNILPKIKNYIEVHNADYSHQYFNNNGVITYK